MSWKRILRFPLFAMLLAWLVANGGIPVPAADKPGDTEVRRLTIYPAAEPVPALKYQLLPGLMERTPGNAAVLYNRVLIQLNDQLTEDAEKKIDGWQGTEGELPIAEVRDVLKPLEPLLNELAVAARRDSCQWDIPFGKGKNPFTVVLPELQKQRKLARVLCVQTRLAIQERRYGDAVESLKTGFAFARDIGNGPTLIHGLVGIAVSNVMMQQVEELSQHADAPNLYWALAAMPRPLIDLRRGLETEMHILDLWMPDLQDPESAGNDPAFWEAKLDEVTAGVREMVGGTEPEAGYRAVLTLLALKGYPKAVQYMVSRGCSKEEVASMHSARVILTATIEDYRRQRDGAFKWHFLPFYEARQGVSDWEAQFAREGRDNEVLPLASMILPAIGASKLAVARHHRSLDAARLIEALRIHAAATGSLPARAEEITEVPIPTDPVWGRPFDVSRDGDTLVIVSAPVPFRGRKGEHGLRIEVRLAN